MSWEERGRCGFLLPTHSRETRREQKRLLCRELPACRVPRLLGCGCPRCCSPPASPCRPAVFGWAGRLPFGAGRHDRAALECLGRPRSTRPDFSGFAWISASAGKQAAAGTGGRVSRARRMGSLNPRQALPRRRSLPREADPKEESRCGAVANGALGYFSSRRNTEKRIKWIQAQISNS